MRAEPTSGRYGAPQIFAAVLLLLFLAQCGWFISRVPLNHVEASYIVRGVALLHGSRDIENHRSPLISEAAVTGILPMLLRQSAADSLFVDPATLDRYRWLVRAPFLLAGLLLGASVWYVARRLYGNNGGYVAIGLYCFTPALIARSSLAGPDIFGAWGAFGVVFASIAVAHTLYAPREVFLWNRNRIALLGIAIGIMIGTQFSLIWVLPVTLLFMLWAVPERRGAALGILAASCAVAVVYLWIIYGTNTRFFFHSLAAAHWGFALRLGSLGTLSSLLGGFYLREAPAVGLLTIVAMLTYLGWSRARFFGTTVPLLIALEMVLLASLMPGAGGGLFFFYCLPFLIVFSAGVFADLIESRRHNGLGVGVAYGAVVAQAGLSVIGLIQLSRGYR